MHAKITRFLLLLAFLLAPTWETPPASAHGGDPTLVHSCINERSGAMKIVGANGSCRQNETALDWPGASTTPGGGSIMVHGGAFGACLGCPTTLLIRTGGGAGEYRMPRDGKIQNVRIRITSNSFDGPAVVTFIVDGHATAISTVVLAGSTSDVDIPHTVEVLDGNRLAITMDVSAISGGSIDLAVTYEIL